VNLKEEAKMRISGLIFILTILLFSISCNKQTHTISIQKLQSAPDTVTINDRPYVLDVYLWRDFMPVTPPEGKPLQASVKIVPVDTGYVEPNLDANEIWIIHGEKAWAHSLENVGKPGNLQKRKILEKAAHDGPKWEPGIKTTVIVRITDTEGNAYLLKSDGVMIHRTE
jgi:hypothetical protein